MHTIQNNHGNNKHNNNESIWGGKKDMVKSNYIESCDNSNFIPYLYAMYIL